MRLIDADALIDFIDLGHLRNPSEICFSECDVVDLVKSRPAVDVELVRHGRWLTPKGIIECSECGFGMFPDGYFFDFGECRHANESQYRPNHCPRCGAKMDGEEADG